MRRQSLWQAVVLTAAAPGMLLAQMNLANLSSYSAWAGKSVRTIVDTLDVSTEVGYGQAKTVVTLLLRPDTYASCYWTSVYDSSLGYYRSQQNCTQTAEIVDSVEMSLSFTLPTDFVASAMTLWVNGTPVAAEIQDRSLANAQYTQITTVQRKDPALLEFWGGGSYNLRIFPTSSGRARKVAIEFRHTFDDDSASLITACVPVVNDTTYYTSSYYGYYYANGIGAPVIGTARLTCRSLDGAMYTVSTPGLGSASFGPNRIAQLTARSIASLGATTIATSDPSGAQKYVWMGSDARTGATNAGLAVPLDPGAVVFDNEPDTRVIAIDVRNTVWDWADYYRDYYAYYGYGAYAVTPDTVQIWQRAQKFAVLALRSYLKADQKFNVVIGGPSVKTVFGAPVPATEENLQKAFREILAATPSQRTSTAEVLRSALLQAPKGAIVLVSDLYMPYDYYAAPKSGNYTLSATGTAYSTVLAGIRAIADSCEATLFDISDNWDLNSASVATGGFRMGTLMNDYGLAYEYHVIDGKRIMSIKMPPMFGSYNPLGVKVTSVAVTGMTNVVYSNDWQGSYAWWPQPYYYIDRPVMYLDKKRGLGKMVLPNNSYGEQTLVRMAGKVAGPGTFPYVIKGKMSGLGFTVTGTGAASGSPAAGDVQYAFRTTEWLAARDYAGNAAAIKQIGKDYHIVTRQTSLLALEPGMKMWEDTIAQQQQTSGPTAPTAGTANGAPAAFASMDAAEYSSSRVAAPSSSSAGVDVDNVSVESLIGGSMAVNGRLPGAARSSVSVKVAKGNLLFTIPAGLDRLTIRLYDAAGRVAGTTKVTPADAARGCFVWKPGTAHAGFFVLRIDGEGFTQQQRLLLGR